MNAAANAGPGSKAQIDFAGLRDVVAKEVRDGYWRHVPRVIYDFWQQAGGAIARDETSEQRHVGRFRNNYVFLEELGNVKSISHVLNGRVVFTRALAHTLFLEMLGHWHFDPAAIDNQMRRPIQGCDDTGAGADHLVSLIFAEAKSKEREGFKVAKQKVKEQPYRAFADQLSRFSEIYILSRYRSIRGLSREEALKRLFEDQAKPDEEETAALPTAMADFAGLGGALASSLEATAANWVWVCDFGIPRGRGDEDADWLAYLNVADLRTAFQAFEEIHTRVAPELVTKAHERCRFVVKNSPTVSAKRAELFKNIEFIERLSRDPATLTANPLPEQVPSEWKPLLVGPRGQFQKLFPQTVVAGHGRDGFEFYYFPRDIDSGSSVDTLLIDIQPADLIVSLSLASVALGTSSSSRTLEAQKKLAFLSWDILSLREFVALGTK